MFSYEYPRPQVTCDIAVKWRSKILLIERKNDPFKGFWCFPGGFMEMGERLATCASRELREETGLKVDAKDLEYISCYDAIHRDPRARTLTHLFYYEYPWEFKPIVKGADDAAKAEWFDVYELIQKTRFLGFDHAVMLNEIFYEKFLG